MTRKPVIRCSCRYSATFYVSPDKKVRCRLCDQWRPGVSSEQVDPLGYIRPKERHHA